MGSEPARIYSGTKTPPRLCYHGLPSQRPEPLGMMTPPLQAPGSVPFRWEEAPGKPRGSDELQKLKPPSARCLEPPPGMAVLPSSTSPAWQVAKVADGDVPSKSKTVLEAEGPYYVLLRPSASLFDGPTVMARSDPLSCSSFTFGDRSLARKGRSAVWFWKRVSGIREEESPATEKAEAAAAYLPRSYSATSKLLVGDGDGGCGREEAAAAAAAAAANVRITRFRRKGSLPNLSTASTHLWASIYGGLKQVVTAPWRSKRSPSRGWSRHPAH